MEKSQLRRFPLFRRRNQKIYFAEAETHGE